MTAPPKSPLPSPDQGARPAELNDRSREIFRQIVENYLATRRAVGSRNIAAILPMTLSPASVRNVMSDLDKRG
jgi:heat-inducible transcriptional repressor